MFSEAMASTIPLTATEVAAHWNYLYDFLVWLSVFFFVLIIGAMFYFGYYYRARDGIKTKYITGSHLLEGIWIVLPTILLMVIFGWGYYVYHEMVQTPPDAYEIRVIGKQWLWTFQYDNGRTTVGDLYVPMNRPVKLVMTSQDVLHSFFVPNFRVKQDVVPGMYTSVWFTATMPGKHQVFCTEYCGTSHSEMLAKVIVLDDDQWKAWNQNKKLGEIPNAGSNVTLVDQVKTTRASAELVTGTSLVSQGKSLYENKGCVACHTVDGSAKIGPSHKGLFGRQTELANGKKVIADENYIRGHIENPQGSLVKGYSPVMPTFKGLFSETEMNALLAYLKSLK